MGGRRRKSNSKKVSTQGNTQESKEELCLQLFKEAREHEVDYVMQGQDPYRDWAYLCTDEPFIDEKDPYIREIEERRKWIEEHKEYCEQNPAEYECLPYPPEPPEYFY